MKSKMSGDLRVAELFAGVGGFRIGLERAGDQFQVVFSNQWEPSMKRQDASDIYVKRFGAEGHVNTNLYEVPTKAIPDHDLLVGGFPCQDYSVARTLQQAKGLEGKKGVLWWQIHRILEEKKNKPSFLLLENVDRLLKSPAKQRGRDFAIMLASLADLGYVVEWRVINAADYGMPQRRRRVFFLGYHKSTALARAINSGDPMEWLLSEGIMAKAFPAEPKHAYEPELFPLAGDLAEISARFNKSKKTSVSPFFNAGIMIDREVHTLDVKADHQGPFLTLGDVILKNGQVPADFFIPREQVAKWKYQKGAKNEKRKSRASGLVYNYNEGAMSFPDPLDKPSRTIITAEGGTSPSRFKHVIKHPGNGKLRRLTPLELERLNMFPDGHTVGASDDRRAFMMGNALVTGIVERIGRELLEAMEPQVRMAASAKAQARRGKETTKDKGQKA